MIDYRGLPTTELLPMMLKLGYRGFFNILDTSFIATAVHSSVTKTREMAAEFSAANQSQNNKTRQHLSPLDKPFGFIQDFLVIQT
jgi:hypothetical protein